MSFHVSASRTDGGWMFECSRAGVTRFLGATIIGPDALRSMKDAEEPVRILRSLLDEPGVETRSERIFVPDEVIANWEAPSSDLETIGLPALCPYRLSISSAKASADPSGSISVTWMGADYAVPAVTRDGTLVSSGTRRFLLRDPLRSFLDAIDRTNKASTVEERMRCFGAVRQHLLDFGADVKAPDNLRNMVIYQATSLGIETNYGPDGYTFRPELLGDVPSEEEGVAARRKALLNRSERIKFERRMDECYAAGLPEARASYVLSANTYVVVDPGVQAAIKVVREVSRSSAETRRAFFEDKMSFLLPELERVGADGSAIEFSDRVIGIAPWEGGSHLGGGDGDNVWFPDAEAVTFILRDATNETFPVSGGDLDRAVEAIREAHDRGETHVTLNDRKFAIDDRVMEEIERLPVVQKPVGGPEPKAKRAPSKYFFVKPKANFKELAYVEERAKTRGDDVALELGLKSEPKDYQLVGISWMRQAYLLGMKGLLMADDMGLGKTFQVLSFLRWLRLWTFERNGAAKPIMIVAPKTLLGNWLDEVELHLGADGLGRPLKLFGDHIKKVREERGRDITLARHTLKLDEIRAAEWVLTTYETLRDYQISLAQVGFEVVVFDEAQKIKESGAMVTEAARSQKAAALRILMTGTPVENSLMDLWTLFDVAWPGRLGYTGEAFKRDFIRSEAGDLSAIRTLLIEPSNDNGVNLPPLMMRRMKEAVASLPPKHIRPKRADMPEEQARAYSQIVALKDAGRLSSLAALQSLRNVSLHPDLGARIDYSDPTSIRSFIVKSARMVSLFEILDEVKANKQKALVFVDLRKAQSVLAEIIKAKYELSHLPYVINGETTTEKRDTIRRGFQKRLHEFEVLLLAPKAVGFGLTLHAANHVIHLNRWWNPAVEDQCTDRAYRLGQNDEVHVWLPIARHPEFGDASYDIVLDEMLDFKRTTSREVIVPVQFNAEEMADLNRKIFKDEIDQNELAAMDWKRFEEWVIERLIDAGFRTNRTPRTNDRGADAVAVLVSDRGTGVIVQAKHRSHGRLGIVSEQEVLEVLQARDLYGLRNPKLFLATNGAVEPRGKRAAEWHGIGIVDYTNIGNLGTVVREAC
jgi:hypothetical protein